MDTARIAALLRPFLKHPLAQPQLEQISIYIDILIRWNARINLTAIRNEEEIVTRHFGESLFMARHLFSESAAVTSAEVTSASSHPRVLDIGSGAGFPGLPLKIWAPAIQLTMIESNHKKATFLREVVRALTLTNVDIIADRAEALADQVGKGFPPADVVTLRAVERLEKILPHAIKFLAPTGTLALLIGFTQLPTLTSLPQLKWNSPIPIPQSRERVLTISVPK